MADSRNFVLERLRAAQGPALPLPDLATQAFQRYEDPAARFREMLTAVGGSAVSVPNLEAAQAELERMPAYASAKLISSLVPGLGRLDLDPNAVADPHELEKVDFAIVPGVFAVAENAAVWLSAAGLRHRALWFLAQHLAIVLPAHELVHNLHEAYARLTFEAPGFGAFVSGPSKTADIEQSLVIGAHGARSCVVFLVGDARA